MAEAPAPRTQGFGVHVGPERHALRVIQKIERLHATTTRLGVVSSAARERAADAYWRRRELILTRADGRVDAAALRRHAVGYLARYREEGGRDREILAKLQIAEHDWRRSCPRRGLLGLCVTWTTTEAPARAAANELINKKSLQRIDEALRVQLRRSLAPAVQQRFEDKGQRFVASDVFDRALVREVARALPPARAEALERAGLRKPGKAPRRCDELLGRARERIVVHKRDEALVKATRARLEELRRLAKHRIRDLSPARERALYTALGTIKLLSLDDEFESLLQDRKLADLQFHVDEWKRDSGLPRWEREYKQQVTARAESLRRLERLHKRVRELSLGYYEITAYKLNPGIMFMGASRAAAVPLAVAALLRGAAIPRALTAELHRYALCDGLADQAEPMRRGAVDRLTYCADRATSYQFFSPAARWCEDRVTREDPARWPPLLEFVGSPLP